MYTNKQNYKHGQLMLRIAFWIMILLYSNSKQHVRQIANNSNCLFISLYFFSEQSLIQMLTLINKFKKNIQVLIFENFTYFLKTISYIRITTLLKKIYTIIYFSYFT